jgi:hypothetical protein
MLPRSISVVPEASDLGCGRSTSLGHLRQSIRCLWGVQALVRDELTSLPTLFVAYASSGSSEKNAARDKEIISSIDDSWTY